MRNFSLFFLLLVLLPGAVLCRDKTYTIQSPDCSLTVTIGCGDRIVYSVRSDTNQILKPSPLAVRLVSGECWGRTEPGGRSEALPDRRGTRCTYL
mgnify:CR=1 FL=1